MKVRIICKEYNRRKMRLPHLGLAKRVVRMKPVGVIKG
jgi:hypothetical protein